MLTYLNFYRIYNFTEKSHRLGVKMSITLRFDKRIMLRKPTELFFSGCRLRLSLIRDVRKKKQNKTWTIIKSRKAERRESQISLPHFAVFN